MTIANYGQGGIEDEMRLVECSVNCGQYLHSQSVVTCKWISFELLTMETLSIPPRSNLEA